VGCLVDLSALNRLNADGHVPTCALLALDMSNPLPPSLTTLQRWIAEPTDVIFLPSQSFIPNAKGYPVLSKACQAFIRSFVRVRLFSARSCPCAVIDLLNSLTAFTQHRIVKCQCKQTSGRRTPSIHTIRPPPGDIRDNITLTDHRSTNGSNRDHAPRSSLSAIHGLSASSPPAFDGRSE